MTPDEIKEALREKKLTMAAISRRLRPKVSPVSVHRVVHQIPGSKSARIERAVAKAIGREVSEVFGNAA
jgi:lambda repressor-like predicted transcriptional regulator